MRYEEFEREYSGSVRRKKLVTASCMAVAALAGLMELALGPYDLGLEGFGVFLDHLRGVEPSDPIDDYVIWMKSAPRAIAVVTVGAGLGVCGAAMQSALKNPLADPYMTGIASGAGLGVSLGTILGVFAVPFLTGDLGLAVDAFLFAMVPAMAIVGLSSMKERTGPSTMILIGVAVSYMFSAFTTMLKLVASDESFSEVFSWGLGSLGGIGWEGVPFVLFATAFGVLALYGMSAQLNLLAVDEGLAASSGLNVKRSRLLVISVASLVTALLVCFTGTIGFVGLIGPHVMRMFIGSDNRFLVPASAVCGALILSCADCLAVEVTMTGLPVGVITSLLGGPLFIYILIRQRRRVWIRGDGMKLELDDVSFRYNGGRSVLEGITLEFDGPQFVSVLGPNGVGKSTLMHCMNRLLKPVSGTVRLDDRDLEDYSAKELARMIGYVPYSSRTSFPMSVADTVLLGRYPHSGNRRTEEDLRIAHSALSLLRISDLAMRMSDELSAGQHQKVMLARALAQQPGVLLLDEPLSNLDVKHQISVSHLLRDLSRAKGILVIMISHDLNIASRFSDRIVLLNEGRVFADGAPEKVLTPGNVKQAYGIDCEVVSFEGRPHLMFRDTDEDLLAGTEDENRAPASPAPLRLLTLQTLQARVNILARHTVHRRGTPPERAAGRPLSALSPAPGFGLYIPCPYRRKRNHNGHENP